ncbi:Oxysterol-binding protein [Cenococcum geophilum]
MLLLDDVASLLLSHNAHAVTLILHNIPSNGGSCDTTTTKNGALAAEYPLVFIALRAMLILKWFLSILKQQYSSWNEKLRTSFSNTINVKVFSFRKYYQIGHAIFYINAFSKDYLITLPSLYIKGLITGLPYINYTARIDYSGKGWLSRKKNSFTASLYPKVVNNFNPNVTKTTQLIIVLVKQQDKIESPISKGDIDTTLYKKSIIKNQQRDIRKKEKDKGREWERRFFTYVETHLVFDTLLKTISESINNTLINGIWIFDPEKAKNLQPLFQQ